MTSHVYILWCPCKASLYYHEKLVIYLKMLLCTCATTYLLVKLETLAVCLVLLSLCSCGLLLGLSTEELLKKDSKGFTVYSTAVHMSSMNVAAQVIYYICRFINCTGNTQGPLLYHCRQHCCGYILSPLVYSG